MCLRNPSLLNGYCISSFFSFHKKRPDYDVTSLLASYHDSVSVIKYSLTRWCSLVIFLRSMCIQIRLLSNKIMNSSSFYYWKYHLQTNQSELVESVLHDCFQNQIDSMEMSGIIITIDSILLCRLNAMSLWLQDIVLHQSASCTGSYERLLDIFPVNNGSS